MAKKFYEVALLADETARRITSNEKEWTSYLKTANNLYRYSFQDQMLIYAQRPDATACATINVFRGLVLYGFFFGCLFALVRLVTDNLLYTIAMHCSFNTINVLLSYADLEAVPVWSALLIAGICLTGFVVLVIRFLKSYGTEMKALSYKSRYKPYELVTKEGYVAGGVCLLIMCFLIMM